VVYSKKESWKILERKTLTTSRTLRADFKRAREGTIKRLAVRSFYSGEESTRSKVLSLQDFWTGLLKLVSLHLLLSVSFHQIFHECIENRKIWV
jgi:hypothetical protein